MERVLAARGGEVPYEAMADLIELSRGHEDVRHDLLAEMDKQLWNAERDMALAWLCLVAGEAGGDGLRKLIELLGKTESDDVAEAAIPVLTRDVLEAYEDIKRALNASRVMDQRCSLYEVLREAVVLGGASLKRDLTEFARERVQRELERPAGDREAIGPLRLLVDLGAPDARECLAAVRARVRDELSKANLEELDARLMGGSSEESFELTRAILKKGWRDTEERRLREILASLGDGRGVH